MIMMFTMMIVLTFISDGSSTAVGLKHDPRRIADIRAVAHQHIEGVELDLVIVLARVQAIEIGAAAATCD